MKTDMVMTDADTSVPHYGPRNKLLAFFEKHCCQLKFTEENGMVVMFAAFSVLRAHRTFMAVELLSSNGLMEDAAILCRSLIETAINLKWVLASNSESRVEQFCEWENASGKKVRRAWDAWVTQIDLPDVLEVDATGKLPMSWSGISLRSMAVEVDMGADYDFEYTALCNYAHGNAAVFGNYVNIRELTGSADGCEEPSICALSIANKYFYYIVEAMTRFCGSVVIEELNEVVSCIKNAMGAEEFLVHLWEGINECRCLRYTVTYQDYNSFLIEATDVKSGQQIAPVDVVIETPTGRALLLNEYFHHRAVEVLTGIHSSRDAAVELRPADH